MYRTLEVLCVVALFGFIAALLLSRSGGTEKPVEDVAAPVIKTMTEGQMTQQTKAAAADAFSIDPDAVEGLVYYANDDIMDVSELLIVKLTEDADTEAVRSSVEKHVSDQKNLFKNYAPDQYSLLNDSLIEVSGNTLFYCTAQNADALYDAFTKAL